ncbi:TPA: hypothetical protein ACX6RJ_000110 [Photobacterium damselae]
MVTNIANILQTHFNDCLKSINEISYNKKSKNSFYEGDVELYCLDSIVSKHFSIEPKSADAIYVSHEAIFFIEFKEGNQKNIKSHDIKLKLFEALNSLYKIIGDKSPSPISKKDFWDQKIHYIVIYRDDDKLTSFTKRLERSTAKWGLDEYKGLFITSATTEYDPTIVGEIIQYITEKKCNITCCCN